MAGEYDVARTLITQAMDSATDHPSMGADVMASALLNTLLARMMKTHDRKDLESMISFQLDSYGEDEFVVTRGS